MYFQVLQGFVYVPSVCIFSLNGLSRELLRHLDDGLSGEYHSKGKNKQYFNDDTLG